VRSRLVVHNDIGWRRYGLKMGDAVLAEDKHLPLYSELVEKYDVKYIAGGATQNSIRVAQWAIGQAGATTYVGCIGKDEFGAKIRDAATKDGVNVLYREDADKPTGTCAVLVVDKERSLCANLAAANEYKVEHFMTEPVQAALEAARLVYSGGFHLTVCPDAMEAAGKHCADAGKVFAFNLSAPFLCSVFKEPMHRVLPYATLVFGNETEAAAFADANGLSSKSPADVAAHIASLPLASGAKGRVVCITQGVDPVIVAKDGKVTEYPVPKVPAEEIVDLNGAGDAFVGGFIAAYAKGRDIDACVAAGNLAASHIIRTSGCVVPAVAVAV
jgi:adenosine kinase